ncbi:MAG: LamG-like jellyroll fold domain-containing protein [Thermoguttaceae bacterium]|jgi:hypothetical protein|nr:LamG-like jellyroll fold domain-containing protein [Thermoguttaceae bacterium]
MTKARVPIILVILLVCPCLSLWHDVTLDARAGSAPWPEGQYPFQPDRYTLLLARFDSGIEEADYAMGYRRFGGMGFLPAEGYYGRGLDLDRDFLHDEFYTQSDSALPFYFNFGFSPHGNFDVHQGTLEFWFLLKDDKEGPFLQSDNSRHRIGCRISPRTLRIFWAGAGPEDIQGTVTFPEPLGTHRWHYYTQTWSEGEFAVYIDGRLVFTHDMREVQGIVSSRVDKPGIYFGAASWGTASPLRMTMDELAVSNVVRYTEDFEPPWRDGVRPDDAFAGLETPPPRYPGKARLPVVAESFPVRLEGKPLRVRLAENMTAAIDRSDGFIKAVTAGDEEAADELGGILIWEGLERTPLFHAVQGSDFSEGENALSFRQRYGDDLVARSTITPGSGRTVWEVTLENLADRPRRLEVQFSLPLPFRGVTEYFDGSVFHDLVHLPRRKDEFAKTVPFSAAGSAGRYAGVGLSSEVWVSDLINEWLPLGDGGGAVRQGFKAVIDPQQEVKYAFFLLAGGSRYGARKALEQYYHAHDGPLYTKNPRVSVLTHMPCTYVITNPGARGLDYGREIARLLYCGHDWRHEPNYGIKGDEAGIGPWFKNEKYLDVPEYEYAKVKWNQFADLEAYRQRQIDAAKSSYEQNYTMHVRHWHPQCLNILIINGHYPEGLDMVGDKLQCGQKYANSRIRACMVNTYNTPLLGWNQRQADFFAELWGPWNKGFTHDTTYDCTARFSDPIALRTAGRSFGRDKEEYLRLAFGFGQWFRYLGTLRSGQRDLAALGDGSYVSYITAVTADKHLTEEMRFNDNMGYPGRFSTGRILSGEKAFDAPIGRLHGMDLSHEWLGDRFMELTEPELRNYYRYFFDQYMLHCFRHGVYMSSLLTHGKQKQVENRALMVECIMAGWRVVPGAEANGALFLARYGDKFDTILVIGNHKPHEQTTDVAADGDELHGDGAALVFADYYGEPLSLRFDGTGTVARDVTVPRRSVTALRAIGALRGSGAQSADVEYEGNGIEFTTRIMLKATPGSRFQFTPFVPNDYVIGSVTIGGVDMPTGEAGAVALVAEEECSVIEVRYRSAIIRIAPADWDEMRLLEADRALVQVVVPEDATEMDKGTLDWIDAFIVVHDYEDNVKGNLKPLEAALGDSDFPVWKVTMHTAPAESPSVVLDGSHIVVHGADEFARKRAMAVFMRLLERKHTHVGSFLFPCDLNLYDTVRQMSDRKVAEVIERYDLQKKPLLRDEYEHLYDGGNLDFHGRYSLKRSPYIYEPGDWR